MLKVLVATDGSQRAREARQLLHEMLWPEGMEIHALIVEAPFDEAYYRDRPSLEPVWEARKEWAAQTLAETVTEFHDHGANVTGEARTGDAAQEIITAARDLTADLVVLGSHGQSELRDILLGSVANGVVRHAPTSVLIGRPVRGRARSIVLAVDGSPHSEHAVGLLSRWPLRPGTEILVVHVRHPYHPVPLEAAAAGGGRTEGERREQVRAEELVAGVCAQLGARGLRATSRTMVGDPADQLLRFADDQQADLIVAGARGASLLEQLVLGSVADRLLRHAKCSVLLARQPVVTPAKRGLPIPAY